MNKKFSPFIQARNDEFQENYFFKDSAKLANLIIFNLILERNYIFYFGLHILMNQDFHVIMKPKVNQTVLLIECVNGGGRD